MGNTLLQSSERIYSFLLKLYPAPYQQDFGSEMQFVFSEQLKDASQEQGLAGIFKIWLRTTTDVSCSVLVQHLDSTNRKDSMKKNNIARIFLGTGLLLLIPLVAMQFTDEVVWDETDFIVAGSLLLGAGLGFEFLTSKLKNNTHRIIVGLGILALLMIIWAELAVGILD